MNKQQNEWVRIFDVNNAQRDGRRNSRNKVDLKIVSRIFAKNSIDSVTEIVVWKRYSEFVKLYKALSSLHGSLYLHGSVPVFPDIKLFGRPDGQQIEERRVAALELLQYASQYPVLYNSSAFVKFFEQADTYVIKNNGEQPENLPTPLEPLKFYENGNGTSDLKQRPNDTVTEQRTPDEFVVQFDPLKNVSEDVATTNDSWLLSAFSTTAKKEVEYVCEGYPEPFSGFASVERKCEDTVNHQSDSADKLMSPVVNENVANETYLLDAASLIVQAQEYEQSCEFEVAFESYKCAVGILLEGVKTEEDLTKRDAVRRKTLKYISRAESIHDSFLNESYASKRRWAPDSPFKSSLFLSSISLISGELKELNNFKVIGLVGNVQIVSDLTSNKKYAIKTLHASSNLPEAQLSKANLFPQNIPHLVSIHRVFETEHALFLQLEYFSDRNLKDYLMALSLSTDISPCGDCTLVSTPYIISNTNIGDVKLIKSENDDDDFYDEPSMLSSFSGSISSIDSIGYDETSNSYLNLCNDYAMTPKTTNDRLGKNNSVITSNSNAQNDLSVINLGINKEYSTPSVSSQSKPVSHSNSTDRLGISSLLQKAKVLLKNVDNTLKATTQVMLGSNLNLNNASNLRESNSDTNLTLKRISPIYHQLNPSHEACTHKKYVAESMARKWFVQIITCLYHLHKVGIYFVDFNSTNILIKDPGEELMICYLCKWNKSEGTLCSAEKIAKNRIYIAPEVIANPQEINYVVDWWSFGIIAYETLTGRNLRSYFPNGINSYRQIYIPGYLSIEAQDLVRKLLETNPSERLGYRGIEDFKIHPFFSDVVWENC